MVMTLSPRLDEQLAGGHLQRQRKSCQLCQRRCQTRWQHLLQCTAWTPAAWKGEEEWSEQPMTTPHRTAVAALTMTLASCSSLVQPAFVTRLWEARLDGDEAPLAPTQAPAPAPAPALAPSSVLPAADAAQLKTSRRGSLRFAACARECVLAPKHATYQHG